MSTSRAVLAALLVSAPLPAASQAPALWPVGAKPSVAIGVEEGEPEYEFAGVTGVRRMANGMVVVANTKPLELRVFDAKGKFVRRIGRSGNGPGELRGDVRLLPAGGDSVVAFVSGRLRNVIYRLDGTLLGETVFERNLSPMLTTSALASRTSIWSGGAPISGCVRPVLAAISKGDEPMLRELYSDQAGRSWVRDFGARQFTVYSPAGRGVGRVMLPAGFEPMQITATFVAGVGRLGDDIEQIQVWPVTTPAAVRAPCMDAVDSFPVPSSLRLAEMKTLVRNAATASEASYVRYNRYVYSQDSLELEVPSDMVYRTLRATGNGWAISVFDKKSTLFCVMGVGDAAPAAWGNGMLRCGS
jgi:hypothetical protein